MLATRTGMDQLARMENAQMIAVNGEPVMWAQASANAMNCIGARHVSTGSVSMLTALARIVEHALRVAQNKGNAAVKGQPLATCVSGCTVQRTALATGNVTTPLVNASVTQTSLGQTVHTRTVRTDVLGMDSVIGKLVHVSVMLAGGYQTAHRGDAPTIALGGACAI